MVSVATGILSSHCFLPSEHFAVAEGHVTLAVNCSDLQGEEAPSNDELVLWQWMFASECSQHSDRRQA